jgi:O-antigen ligase
LVISEWRNTSKLWNRVLLFAIFGSILANIALTETNFYIIEKINNSQIDEGSGRLDIYQETWQQNLNKPLINQMFGSGHNAVALGYSQASIMEIKSRSAHNDFLEILFDYGITGIAIYLYFIVSLIKVLKKSKQYNKKLYVILISSLLVFFLLSMYSHLNLYPENYIFIVAVWGYYCAQLDSKTSKRKLSFIVDENEIENIPSSRSLPYKKLQIYICK